MECNCAMILMIIAILFNISNTIYTKAFFEKNIKITLQKHRINEKIQSKKCWK